MTTHRQILEVVVTKAKAMLSRRQTYAADVIAGNQRWSGADLKGKAKEYSSSYARGRRSAYSALRKAGGQVIAVEHNRKVTAVYVCTDDYGNRVYATRSGFVRPVSRSQCRGL